MARAVHLDDSPARGQLIALALEARLLGRLRLLTVDAVVDVADLAAGPRPVVDARVRDAPRPLRARRAEAEALLQDARRSLAATPSAD
ncbi:hypothetical protein HC251_21405 [Iamia sp. SCSIO 61187]|uniref:hypothetical protein n=1 Tax=Iamia sp. SCSIO 61187 TaxID=2722752 RepID=UPI001C632226|nr:hypothetical protein [Iamia sp. SCSIO 61187]QYG94739.1 hypothetical protein HC251_21405 [Iamia sp. SCSIO 61187]